MMDEGHGSCKELGTTTKKPPAYGDRHGMKDGAVNWGDPPLHRKKNCKEAPYKSKRRSGFSAGRESEGLIVPRNRKDNITGGREGVLLCSSFIKEVRVSECHKANNTKGKSSTTPR
ncbi:hypothetical protein GC093_07855 [Paenibacillus sp. LMG 31456]|uniref:Uncharacterized protein n=1 Tax=Paenibacillus foliorum TaxID=2654974 RepID=A0A972K0R6_9BACL|nr:hypothetical protein [Paenibacillus foliorum]NOU93143.1 hypothetical protein [Paenibacillus foliorum]